MRNIGAIVLAAGGSTRLGQPKQLLVLAGETLVRRVVNAASAAGCAPIAVVVGAVRDRIAAELRDTGTETVENDEWQRGLGTSIKCGLAHLLHSQPDLTAVLLLVCDQPFADATLIRALIDEHERSGKAIVASSYEPRPLVMSTEVETSLKETSERDSSASVGMTKAGGVPALFDRGCFEALLGLPDDSGAKRVIEADLTRVAWVAFPEGVIDIDTPADLARWRNAQ
jgi:molybdenum cofactor cytidylyltransferase